MSRVELLCVKGPVAGRAMALRPKDRVSVGRSPECDFEVESPTLSKRHFEVEADGGRYRIADLGSRNGTKVGGMKVEGTIDLFPGQVIEASAAVVFMLVVEEEVVETGTCEFCGGAISGEDLDLGSCAACRTLSIEADASIHVTHRRELPSPGVTEVMDGPPPPPPLGRPSGPVAGRRIGPFVVVDQMGKGAMGVVLKVWDERRREELVLKMLHDASFGDDKIRERFLREGKLLLRIRHPGVVPVVEIGEIAGRPYFAMPFVSGVDVYKRVQDQGVPPIAEALDWMVQAARAAHHVHEEGVVHRDIKPRNLMIDLEGSVRIIDFGIAATFDASGLEHLTATGVVLGSPYYLPPEQMGHARDADRRADVYSLGATLFYTLTGDVPFERRDSVIERIRQALTKPPRTPSDIRADCPPAVDAIVAKAMAKKPEDRFQTAEDLAKAMDAVRRA